MSGNVLTDSDNMPDFVYLKTFRDTFLTALPQVPYEVKCDRPFTLEWEMFKVIDNRDGTISLLSVHGRFLAADPNGDVMCKSHFIGDWEKWSWEILDSGKHTLMSTHKKYLSAKASGIVKADVSEQLQSESFEIVRHTDSIRRLQHEQGFELVARFHEWLPADRNMSTIKNMNRSDVFKRTSSGLSDDVSTTAPSRDISRSNSFSSDSSSDSPPTTLMIRNIPNCYAQKQFMAEFESLGFGGTFDFFYLAMDKKTMCNMGYCFVNFVDHHWAARCADVLNDYAFEKQRKNKVQCASVLVAHLQGLEANIAHYENTPVMKLGNPGRRLCRPFIVRGIS